MFLSQNIDSVNRWHNIPDKFRVLLFEVLGNSAECGKVRVNHDLADVLFGSLFQVKVAQYSAIIHNALKVVPENIQHRSLKGSWQLWTNTFANRDQLIPNPLTHPSYLGSVRVQYPQTKSWSIHKLGSHIWGFAIPGNRNDFGKSLKHALQHVLQIRVFFDTPAVHVSSGLAMWVRTLLNVLAPCEASHFILWHETCPVATIPHVCIHLWMCLPILTPIDGGVPCSFWFHNWKVNHKMDCSLMFPSANHLRHLEPAIFGNHILHQLEGVPCHCAISIQMSSDRY